MYPAVTFWWLKACCERGYLLHPCEAALFRPRPSIDGCPDFKGKVVAFAGLGKAPATFEQYMKEAVLVLGCSWSGEMHKGVHVLINCLPPLKEHDKITWTCVHNAALNSTSKLLTPRVATIKRSTFPSSPLSGWTL
jgi:hypothetical protein